jgi:hypothetical protein
MRHMYGEGHIEVSHVLIGLIGFGCKFEQLGDILPFPAGELGDAGLDPPLFALGACIRRDTRD